MNQRLEEDATELKSMMKIMGEAQGMAGLSEASAFTDLATAVYNQLHDRGELLSSKESLLWEKEHELEAMRVMVNARAKIETEMAQFINIMAADLSRLNLTVPSGLASRPYISLDVARLVAGDDGERKGGHPTKFSFELKAEAKTTEPASLLEEALLAAEGLTMDAVEGLALLSRRAAAIEDDDDLPH